MVDADVHDDGADVVGRVLWKATGFVLWRAKRFPCQDIATNLVCLCVMLGLCAAYRVDSSVHGVVSVVTNCIDWAKVDKIHDILGCLYGSLAISNQTQTTNKLCSTRRSRRAPNSLV